MQQVAQNYRSGQLSVLDVPVPACKPGGVLVRSLFSLISTGTEMMKVSEARLSLLGKARARPDQVKKLVDAVAQQGAVATYQKAMNKLDSYTPLGYSLCGVVVEVGAGAEQQFSVGQVVAAAGNEFALHAEYNWVPVNLCVPVPDGVAPEHAAFATVGAIAMQGVRQAEAALGETAVVVGLGLIGQLVVRLLVASGVHVLGVDTVAERCREAEKAGALACFGPDDAGVAQLQEALGARTKGFGADHILLTAGGDSNGPVELAAKVARDRARIVDIGKTRLDLPWNAYYEKELDFRFSRSYGPGRYDDRYELEGVDYPAGYVRWTERRNLACFVDLLAGGSMDVSALVSGVHPIAEAESVYARISSGELKGIGFMLSYPEPPDRPAGDTDPIAGLAAARTMRAAPAVARRPARTATGPVRVGFIGAGNYASSMLLPHLRESQDVDLVSVATTTALSGMNAQKKFGFSTVSTDVEAVLGDDSLGVVFVVTRHATHARFVCEALRRGKAVFVEKPLALEFEQVDEILTCVEETGNDRIMVGFNRRFAPLFTELSTRMGALAGPVSVRYLVNAGKLDATSWYLNQELEGSRFAGEGSHFIDTVGALIGHSPVEVHAFGAGADVHATLRYDDGSLATISYVEGGSSRFPKETIDVTGGGRNGRLDNFQRATVWDKGGKSGKRSLAGQDKGQKAQLEAFVRAVRSNAPMPISLESIVATTRATLAVGASLAERRPVTL